MAVLCVNIDHIATLREARKITEPDPVFGAVIAELAGAKGITIHVREDRRHIKERDLLVLRNIVKTKLNLEMAAVDEMVEIALKHMPDMVTLVPEKREEVTTEGGLDVVANHDRIKLAVSQLKKKGIIVSLFIDPDQTQIDASSKTGAEFVELHTGTYSDADNEQTMLAELMQLREMATYATSCGLRVNAGHGLNYRNVQRVAQIPEVEELNIGHSVISHAVFVGLERAIKEMNELIESANH